MPRPRCLDVLAYAAAALFLVLPCCFSVHAKTASQNVSSRACTKTESFKVTINVTESVPYTVKESYRCFKNLKLKCEKNKIELRPVVTKKDVLVNRTVEECCEGYVRSTNGTGCISVACQLCKRGTCASSDVCECDENYSGPYCNYSTYCKQRFRRMPTIMSRVGLDRQTRPVAHTRGFRCSSCYRKACPFGKFGESCAESCRCANGSPCDPYDGRCKCSAGWTGIDCSKRIACPPGNCDFDHEISELKCRPGYTGLACRLICPPYSYGQGCRNSCDCENGVCHHVTGECHCYSGWTGSNCTEKSCSCQNGGICRSTVDSSGSVCDCKQGFVGLECSEKCSPPYYGDNCSKKCDCFGDNFICDADIGCTCKQGHTGEHCNITILSSTSSMRPLISSTYAENISSGSFVGMSVIIIALIATIMTLLLYYRKRVAALNTVIDNVKYEVDKKDAGHDLNKNRTDQRQLFCNAVRPYAQTSIFTGTTEEHGGGALPNDNGQMRISFSSPTSCYTIGGEGPSSLMIDSSIYGGRLSSDGLCFKKRDAARSDSNTYCIIDSRTESENDGDDSGDNEVYDRLDFQYANNTWKPHYQQNIQSKKTPAVNQLYRNIRQN